MEEKTFDVHRNIYKSVMKMNRQRSTDILSDIYDMDRTANIKGVTQ